VRLRFLGPFSCNHVSSSVVDVIIDTMDRVTLRDAFAGLKGSYESVTNLAGGLAGTQFSRPTRCATWTVADLLFHMLGDAQRALIAFATPADEGPDVDFVTYWKPFKPGDEGAAAHARHIKLGAAAYRDPTAIAARWSVTAGAAVRAAADCRHGFVITQGHVISVPDFLVTLAVEATIHHLDLTSDLDGVPGPDPGGLSFVRRTLDGLLGAPCHAPWDDATYALKGTGRVPLSAAERAVLGPLGERIPLLG
jgi:uncharacterized protein (TIGR03083 family)